MPVYMDVHEKIRAMTPRALAAAHEQCTTLAGKHDVTYLQYWFNPEAGRMFCLVEGPSREAVVALHREADGLLPNEVWDVSAGIQSSPIAAGALEVVGASS